MSSPPPVDRGRATSVLVVSGYGIRVHVERGQLVVEDGIAEDRRRLCISRVTPELGRLVVLGHAGTVSLDAQQWLHAVGISYLHLDGDGEVLAVGNARALDDVKVLRGQALAPFNGIGITVARELLQAKLTGQARVAARLNGIGAVSTLREALTLLPDARTVEDQRFIESRGAAAYWDAWTGTPVHFVPKDVPRVPAHWRMFDCRRSVLSRSPRKATNPVNALLNYLYAILEAEATIASRSVGLDPRLGVLHVDSNRRDSFACDLMEAVRPQVDAYVLDLLAKRTFLRTDFFETGDGCCRLLPTLTKPLAATAPRWAKLLAPFAERAAGLFAGNGQQVPLTATAAPLVWYHQWHSGHRSHKPTVHDSITGRRMCLGHTVGGAERTSALLNAHTVRRVERWPLRALHGKGERHSRHSGRLVLIAAAREVRASSIGRLRHGTIRASQNGNRRTHFQPTLRSMSAILRRPSVRSLRIY